MEYLKIFTDFARSMAPLDDAERGRLFSAMLAYAESGLIPDLPGNERFVWPTAQLHIDREIAFCEKQRANARRPRQSQTRPDHAKVSQTSQNDKDKDKDKDKDSPPVGGESTPRPRGPYANVFLTDQELELFRAEYHDADGLIRRMGEYLASSGKSYKNYLAALRRWAREEAAKPPPRGADTSRGSPPVRSSPPVRDNSWMAGYIQR